MTDAVADRPRQTLAHRCNAERQLGRGAKRIAAVLVFLVAGLALSCGGDQPTYPYNNIDGVPVSVILEQAELEIFDTTRKCRKTLLLCRKPVVVESLWEVQIGRAVFDGGQHG